MPINDEEAPRLAEIGRRISEMGQTLSDFRHEIRAQLHNLMPRETYYAERDAMRDRLTNLEKAAQQQEANHRSTRMLIYTAILSAAVSILLLLLERSS